MPYIGAMQPILSVANLSKTYKSGFQALKNINLEIRKGEIFAPPRPERRRQDDADQHHLRHRQSERGPGHRRRLRHHPRLPADPFADRPGAAGADHRCVRDAGRDLQPQPRPVRQEAGPGARREGAEGAVALGQARPEDHHAVGRHEAPGADRQGAVARAARSSSSTSRRRASTSSSAATCGNWCAGCATAASPSS